MVGRERHDAGYCHHANCFDALTKRQYHVRRTILFLYGHDRNFVASSQLCGGRRLRTMAPGRQFCHRDPQHAMVGSPCPQTRQRHRPVSTRAAARQPPCQNRHCHISQAFWAGGSAARGHKGFAAGAGGLERANEAGVLLLVTQRGGEDAIRVLSFCACGGGAKRLDW